MTPAISLVFTSRNRPESLSEALLSLHERAADPDAIEAIIAIDPDDGQTRTIFRDPPMKKITLWTAPERYGYTGLHEYLNRIAKLAGGHWLMWFNDDMRMVTDRWDEVIRGHRDAILWPSANHVQHANIAPIWPKAWSDAAGCVSPTTHMDTWLQRAGEQLGCHDRIPVHIVHDRADVTGNHDDQTYREGRWQLGPEGMAGRIPMELLPAWCAAVEAIRG